MGRQVSRRPSPLMSRPACQPVLCLAVRPVCRQLSLEQCHDRAISECVANFLGTISDSVSWRVDHYFGLDIDQCVVKYLRLGLC